MKKLIYYNIYRYMLVKKKSKCVVGSKLQVFNKTCTRTAGGLTRSDLKVNKNGKVVSKARSVAAKKNKNLGAFQINSGNKGFSLQPKKGTKAYKELKSKSVKRRVSKRRSSKRRSSKRRSSKRRSSKRRSSKRRSSKRKSSKRRSSKRRSSKRRSSKRRSSKRKSSKRKSSKRKSSKRKSSKKKSKPVTVNKNNNNNFWSLF